MDEMGRRECESKIPAAPRQSIEAWPEQRSESATGRGQPEPAERPARGRSQPQTELLPMSPAQIDRQNDHERPGEGRAHPLCRRGLVHLAILLKTSADFA